MVTSVVKWAFPREFKGVVQKFPRAPPPDPAHASVRFYPGSAPEFDFSYLLNQFYF